VFTGFWATLTLTLNEATQDMGARLALPDNLIFALVLETERAQKLPTGALNPIKRTYDAISKERESE